VDQDGIEIKEMEKEGLQDFGEEREEGVINDPFLIVGKRVVSRKIIVAPLNSAEQSCRRNILHAIYVTPMYKVLFTWVHGLRNSGIGNYCEWSGLRELLQILKFSIS